MGTFFKIGKIEAARRQITTAAQLFFSNGDCISIHALASAAYDVIRDVNEARGQKTDFEMAEETHIKPESLAEFRRKRNSVRNFFKHANKDPESFMELSVWLTQFTLFSAISAYGSMTGDSDLFMSVYVMWFLMNNPKICKLPAELSDVGKEYETLSPPQFLNEMMPLVVKLRLIKTSI